MKIGKLPSFTGLDMELNLKPVIFVFAVAEMKRYAKGDLHRHSLSFLLSSYSTGRISLLKDKN